MNYLSYLQIIIVYFILLILVKFFGNYESYEFLKIVLSMASFIFAILLGFSISDRQKRFTEIRNTLRDDDACLVNIYRFSSVFGLEVQENIKKLIDEYLISQIDYYLIDYEKSAYLLVPIHNYILKLSPKDTQQEIALNNMLGEVNKILHNQKNVIYWLGDRLTKLEWMSPSLLYGIIIILLLYFNDQNMLSLVILPIVGAALFIPLLILKNLNSLQWQNQHWDWKSLTKLFIELELEPYYPTWIKGVKEYLKDHGGAKYRLAEYPSKYPEMGDKIVHHYEIED